MSNGVSEYVTKIVEKPKEKVHSKTIDYIDNAIMANLSKVIIQQLRLKEAIKASRLSQMVFSLKQPLLTSVLSLANSLPLPGSKQ